MRERAGFSARTAWDTSESPLARALAERRREGLPVLDLTASNPTQCSFVYDEAAILSALGRRESLNYDPTPLGMLAAREAVAAYYAEHGAIVEPENILLTTSTSEAYSFLFRLLCDPGDEVLIAQPSYPLFDFLAQIEDIRLVSYPLFYDHGWHLDAEGLRQRITERTRAIALVHPNNPTGHFTKDAERRELEKICRDHGLGLMVDEVFLDYGLGERGGGSFARGAHPALTFVLSGLSKVAALPQMKAAWIAAFAPDSADSGAHAGNLLLREAMARLEVIADTFLSMNAPVQGALPAWLAGSGAIQEQIRKRLAENLRLLDEVLAEQTMVTRLDVEAGWYAVLRVPAIEADEELAMRLLRERGVSVHPGYFFGFPGRGWLVLSLLAPSVEFLSGVSAITSCFRRLQGNLESYYPS